MHRVLIIGGGFAGLACARGLRRAPVDVTLLDRRNFHLFQPLLYQVATGGLSPANIATPLRALLKRQRNARVVLGEAVAVDPAARAVRLADGRNLDWDTLVVAAGATHHYFGNAAWERHAPGLKTIEDATEIRRRVLLAFERAERAEDPEQQRAEMTFAVVGAGPTGVELAGAIAELARHTLRGEFRRIDTAWARVVLIEAGPRVLATFPEALTQRAQRALQELGVELRLATAVAALDADGVLLRAADGAEERVAVRTVLWAAGVRGAGFGAALAAACAATQDRAGRIEVGQDCALPQEPAVLVLGDLAHHRDADGKPLPGVAPAALQQGAYVARLIRARLRGKVLPPFRYRDKGSMATIGRDRAVAAAGFLQLWGRPAWLAWLFIHILYLVNFQNRLLVLVQWGWNYVTRNRAARLITGTGWDADEKPAGDAAARRAVR